jgi:hypothetical protein
VGTNILTEKAASTTLKMEAVGSFTVLVHTRLHGVNPEDNMNHHHHKNLIFCRYPIFLYFDLIIISVPSFNTLPPTIPSVVKHKIDATPCVKCGMMSPSVSHISLTHKVKNERVHRLQTNNIYKQGSRISQWGMGGQGQLNPGAIHNLCLILIIML